MECLESIIGNLWGIFRPALYTCGCIAILHMRMGGNFRETPTRHLYPLPKDGLKIKTHINHFSGSTRSGGLYIIVAH